MHPVVPTGRFAPSPTGRMHLGNIFTALLAWLSIRSRGGRFVLRIEDLDPQRSRTEYARTIEDDLNWLGLDWDEGGVDGTGANGPYRQSQRHNLYSEAIARLAASGLTYQCRCTRADLHATQAPHASDGLIIYPGTCRPAGLPPFPHYDLIEPRTIRIFMPDEDIEFTDTVFGPQKANGARDCGDFVLRRADGAFAYQLAVVVDDAAMGVTEVVRGADLLGSTFRQIFLYRILGLPEPSFAHVPLLCNAGGIRLSKRDSAMAMDQLRRTFTPEQIIGHLAFLAGITQTPEPISAAALIPLFSWDKLKARDTILLNNNGI